MAAAALAIPSLISSGTSILGGIFGSSAAKKAAQQQAAASAAAQQQVSSAVQGAQSGMGQAVGIANDQVKEGVTGANDTLANVFSGQQQNLQPYLAGGAQGAKSMADLYANGTGPQFSFNPTDLTNEPGYQFQLGQGTEAIKRQAAAAGTAGSGGTMASLMKYGQGLAGTTYQDAYNRALGTFQTNQNTTMQGLQSLIGMGQTGTAQYNQAAQNFGNTTSGNLMTGGQLQSGNTIGAAQYGGNVGMQGAQTLASLITGAGNAQAAGTVGSANAWSGALSGIGNAAQGYAQNTTLASMFGGGYGTAAPSTYTGPTAAQAATGLWGAQPPVPSGNNYGSSMATMPSWMTPQTSIPSGNSYDALQGLY